MHRNMFRFQCFPKFVSRCTLPGCTSIMNPAWKRVLTIVIIVAGVSFMLYSWSPVVYSEQTDSGAAAHRLEDTSLEDSQQKDSVETHRPEAKCPDLHFSRKTLPVTALASFPGSGNTWLRHLIQQSTGERVMS